MDKILALSKLKAFVETHTHTHTHTHTTHKHPPKKKKCDTYLSKVMKLCGKKENSDYQRFSFLRISAGLLSQVCLKSELFAIKGQCATLHCPVYYREDYTVELQRHFFHVPH